ncbi:MAG: hypothetical protein O7B35_12570, partial [Deltaproteobacteria bacterium]|nr:hypothetical protein [Deltaproteobacteria bacterium]
IEANDELDPQTVFSGKFFEAAVGFRSNNLGGELDEANREERKDNRDFLRVHKMIRLVPEDEAAAIVHIRSNGVIWPPET